VPPGEPSISSMLSQALVAFTIEFDNEFEEHLPHRTADYGPTAGGGPWLVSRAMWSTCMRFVTDDGLTVAELTRQARARSNLPGLRRWGYIRIQPEPGGDPKKPTAGAIITPTNAGRLAQQLWEPLDAEIEERWSERFGAAEVGRLCDALAAVADRLDSRLPDCLPILDYGLSTIGKGRRDRYTDIDLEDPPPTDATGLSLPVLLSRVLLAFTIEYEREARIALAIGANVLRVLSPTPVPLRDLPALSGISKEAIAMAVNYLKVIDCVTVAPLPAPGRGQSVRLSPKGEFARDGCLRRTAGVELRWRKRFGADTVAELRAGLAPMLADRGDGRPALFDGLEPYPDGWRAQDRRPRLTLPHFPVPLHRGGYPDGR
jgi:hypothetical protein